KFMRIMMSDTAGGMFARRLLPTVPLAIFVLGLLRMAGQKAGFYDTYFGLSLLVASCMVVSISLIAWNARLLHDADLRRRQAEAATALLAAVVESSDDAVISKDLDGVILSWNRGAEQLFGYTEGEAIGKSILLLIPPEYLEDEAAIVQRIINGQLVEPFETVR